MKTIILLIQLSVILPSTELAKDVKNNSLKENFVANKSYFCEEQRPTSILDLKDGVLIDAYDFVDGDEKALNILGFFNVDIKKQERVTVVEYLQKGSIICEGKVSKYAIGARLMMRVTSHKKKAKLDTPQQITASVIFGKATVKFSMHTFGITGPGVADLNRVGSITENTYSSFISGISDLLAKAYDGNKQYIILPQKLD